MKATLKKYLWNNLLALDRQLNAWSGGDPEMTLSGRMGVAIAQGRCRLCHPICWLLDRIDPEHCARQAAVEAHEGSDEVIRF